MRALAPWSTIDLMSEISLLRSEFALVVMRLMPRAAASSLMDWVSAIRNGLASFSDWAKPIVAAGEVDDLDAGPAVRGRRAEVALQDLLDDLLAAGASRGRGRLILGESRHAGEGGAAQCDRHRHAEQAQWSVLDHTRSSYLSPPSRAGMTQDATDRRIVTHPQLICNLDGVYCCCKCAKRRRIPPGAATRSWAEGRRPDDHEGFRPRQVRPTPMSLS